MLCCSILVGGMCAPTTQVAPTVAFVGVHPTNVLNSHPPTRPHGTTPPHFSSRRQIVSNLYHIVTLDPNSFEVIQGKPLCDTYKYRSNNLRS